MPVKDKTYEFNDEQIRKAWNNIYGSSTFDNALRLSKDSQNRKIKSRKELITKFILFSLIIGQVTIAKEIGGMMVQNKIQKGNLPSQYLVEKSDEDMIREEIDEEIIRAYDCMEESMSMLKYHSTLHPSAGLKMDLPTRSQSGREHRFWSV